MFKINNRNTRTHCSSVSTVKFEHLDAKWEGTEVFKIIFSK